MRQDERAPFDRALGRARVSAYDPGEFVGQESFMRAGEIRALAQWAGIASGVAVLDLCCGIAGPGRFITRELGCSYLGVDASASAIEIARERAAGLPCRFEVAPIPPIPHGPFDVVLLLETMLAFPDKEPLVQEIAAELGEGGRFAFTLEEGLPLTDAERERMPDADTVWLTPLADMLACLERAGLVVRRQEDHSASHRAVADALIDAFSADAVGITAQIGSRALDELLAAHRLWSAWLRSGRVRKLAFVAEKVHATTDSRGAPRVRVVIPAMAEPLVHKRQLGTTGPSVSAVGLGCMGMSGMYGQADRPEAIATIHTALDAGVVLLDTGDFYGMGHNELLVGEALRGRSRDDVVISVKFGAQRGPDGSWLGYDASPPAVKTALAYTLTRLGVDHVDVYRPARLDAAVPIEETVGAIGELVDAGYVRHVGLSEVGADTIRRAHAVRPIVDLQIEYSLISRGIERDILPACRELGIAVTAYGVLSRGLLSGHWSPERELAATDFRAHSPRFQRGNVERNLALVDAMRAIAERKRVTVAQLAIAWVLARGEDVVPLIGARRRDQLDEALAAMDIALDDGDLAALERAVPAGAAAGDRYPTAQLSHLDSER